MKDYVVYASYSDMGWRRHNSEFTPFLFLHYSPKPFELVFTSRPALWQAYEAMHAEIPPIEVHAGWTVEDIAEKN